MDNYTYSETRRLENLLETLREQGFLTFFKINIETRIISESRQKLEVLTWLNVTLHFNFIDPSSGCDYSTYIEYFPHSSSLELIEAGVKAIAAKF